MDYKEKYEQALERAIEALNDGTISQNTIDYLCNIFPELADKDEKIRKAIIKYFTEGREYLSLIPYNKEQVLTWLEKQGEQKSIDKVEPKFKVGDWIVLTAGELSTTLQIVNVDTNKKLYWFNDSSYLPIVDEECLYHWTIKDAKDGDVLITYNGKPFIYKGCLDPYHPDSPVAYCGIDVSDYFRIGMDKCNYWWTDERVHPTTKEERDLLFAKMKEEGYEWDAEKKKLKKISQRMVSAEVKEAMYGKPAWSEEDEHRAEDTIYFLDTAKKHYASTVELDACIDWLKSLKQRYTWKPSDEQMVVLELACKYERVFTPKQIDILIGLKEQLKKLKGE